MPLFRRPDESHERTPEEREYARRLREARRQGLPDPEPPASMRAGPAGGEPAPMPAEPDPVPLPPDQPLDDEPAPDPEPEPEADPEPLAPAPSSGDDVDGADPDDGREPESEPADRDPEGAREPDLTWTDPGEELAWSEPGRGEAQPPDEHGDGEGGDRAELWDEPAPAPPPIVPRGDDVPRRAARGVPRQPPPLPARRAARDLPAPPRRRYAPRDPHRHPAGPPTHRRRRWGVRLVALVAFLAIIGALWFSFNLFQPGKGEGDGRVAVVIPQGATARQIGDLLAERGVVSSGFFFDLRARISGDRETLKAGRFVLAEDMSYATALERLSANPEAPPTLTVAIPEGLSRREIAPLVRDIGVEGRYGRASRSARGFDPTQYGAPRSTSTLEGFLFPATYELPQRRATAGRLVRQQLEAFDQNFGEVNLRPARRKNLTPYDVLIIASMIEREAQVDEERELISAVIYNRLREGMTLGIDATTRYELNEWSRPLRVSELEADTPYNTRINPGLPPTPIGNPGLASMQAAADPANVDYLFYVVKPGTCGEHAFSSNDAQFQRDVAAYEAARAANGGQSPDTCDD